MYKYIRASKGSWSHNYDGEEFKANNLPTQEYADKVIKFAWDRVLKEYPEFHFLKDAKIKPYYYEPFSMYYFVDTQEVESVNYSYLIDIFDICKNLDRIRQNKYTYLWYEHPEVYFNIRIYEKFDSKKLLEYREFSNSGNKIIDSVLTDIVEQLRSRIDQLYQRVIPDSAKIPKDAPNVLKYSDQDVRKLFQKAWDTLIKQHSEYSYLYGSEVKISEIVDTARNRKRVWGWISWGEVRDAAAPYITKRYAQVLSDENIDIYSNNYLDELTIPAPEFDYQGHDYIYLEEKDMNLSAIMDELDHEFMSGTRWCVKTQFKKAKTATVSTVDEREESDDDYYSLEVNFGEMDDPATDIANDALAKLNVWAEPSIQGNMGSDYLLSTEDDRTMAVIDWQTECEDVASIYYSNRGNYEETLKDLVRYYQDAINDYDGD